MMQLAKSEVGQVQNCTWPKKITLETHMAQYCQVMIASGKDPLWLGVKGNGTTLRVSASNGSRRGTVSRDCRGWFDVSYDKTSVVERQRLRFSIFKIITSVNQGQ